MNLGHPDHRSRLDRVAAEYVLGTLSGKARTRLARAAATDPTVARAIADWERRLCGLADAVPAVAPSPAVWDAIARRLRFADAAQPGGWWTRVAFWRAFAVLSFAAFVALGVTTLRERTAAPPGTIVVVLAGPDAKPVLIATASREAHVLRVKAVGTLSVPPDHALELWMLPASGAPLAMGLIDAAGTATLPLAAASGEVLASAKGLAVSLEPPGGSPTGLPTGPILYTGTLETI